MVFAISAGVPEQVFRAGHVGKGLVDGDPLDERGEIPHHLDGRIPQALIFLEMAADERQVRGTARAPRRPAIPP